MVQTHNKITDSVKLNFTDDEKKITFTVIIDEPRKDITAEEVGEVGRFLANGLFFISGGNKKVTQYVCAHKEELTVAEVA